jgi:hypothetical protein
MKWIKFLLIAMILVFTISVILVDRKINIAVTNTTDKEIIKVSKVSLNVEKNKPMKADIGYSMFPMNFYNFNAKLGFQKILVNCPDLKISQEFKIFTIYKNNVDFEFTKDTDDNYILIDRNSWFRLTYE